MAGLLTGKQVFERTGIGPGLFCAMVMADLGAVEVADVMAHVVPNLGRVDKLQIERTPHARCP